jgi:hypothetical protein
VGLVLGKDAAEEGGVVGEGDGVAFVGGINGLIGIEDGDEKPFLAALAKSFELDKAGEFLIPLLGSDDVLWPIYFFSSDWEA